MKLEWVNEWVEKGLLTKEAGDRVNAHATEFVKEANKVETADALARRLAPWVAGALGIGGLAVYDKVQDYKDKKKILENQATIMNMFEQQKDKEKAKARYEELTRVSPIAAINTNLAKSLVQTRLHSGLSTADHQRLALLEAHAKKNRNYKGQNYLAKTGSAEGIRPEVMSDLLADVYIMSKEAGLKDRAFKLFNNETIKNWVTGIALMTGASLTAASIGGGVRAFGDYKDKKKLQQDLEESFQIAVERSDAEKEPLRDNPEKARQAFQALAHFSPRVATQPDAARSFMTRIVSYDQGINAGDIRDLTEIEKNLSNASQESGFVAGFKDVARGTGLTPLFQRGVVDAGKPMSGAVSQSMQSGIDDMRDMEIASQL